MAWTNPKTWIVGEVMSSSDLNTYVRDNFNSAGLLTSYTPTWTGSTTNPTIGNGTLTGRYVVVGDWVWLWIAIIGGTTTTAGSGSYTLTAPFASIATHEQYLDVDFVDQPTSRFYGRALINAGTSNIVAFNPAAWGGSGFTLWSAGTPFTIASTDTVYIHGIYRRN